MENSSHSHQRELKKQWQTRMSCLFWKLDRRYSQKLGKSDGPTRRNAHHTEDEMSFGNGITVLLHKVQYKLRWQSGHERSMQPYAAKRTSSSYSMAIGSLTKVVPSTLMIAAAV